ncbi:glutamate racemase [Hydrogenovibrio marinus]|uniref:Glutamate racemase n=1 Tax=Hydrogenovibrio marinus TaxID=28885 RepID=A0A066ZS22_HYDMR|nr:glutamate racemase [Hydrogenovibrio marinus]KDN96272.1 glutamate racemase [Hydrogenovibrio marinus]BBN60545.1 glutamate racemase [Hydrogenovibrio marinus]
MTDSRPIGVFDSGIGGLPIAQKIRELLPNEKLIYVADTFYAPYGEKSEDTILQRSLAVVDFLMSQDVKAIVVACNTATMVSIKTLRERYDLPFIGVEPGVKPAAIHTKTGVIGVLATEKTLTSHAFDALAKRVAGNAHMEIQPSPKLVRLVEALKLESEEAVKAVEEYVHPLIDKGADTIILGCTHFAHLSPIIEKVAGEKVSVISTELAVAKETVRRLKTEHLLSDSSQTGTTEFFSNGDFNLFQEQIQKLWSTGAQLLSF